MRFSIVIPVYDTEKFLPRCLDSIKAQTDCDYEVVVVDDCSPGNCAEVVKPYGDFVRYVRHERNRGAFRARYTGVEAARGEYIVPVDPDDYLLPETLAKLRAVIERESPDAVSYWLEYDDGKQIRPHWCRHPAAVVTGVEALRELVEHKYFNGMVSKVFRRELLMSVPRVYKIPEEEDYVNTGEDFLGVVAALMLCEKLVFLDFAGYRYFVNEGSISFSWRTRAGYRRALGQIRHVGDLLKRMAAQPCISPERRRLVGEAVAGIEEWFVQMRRESSWMYRLGRRLMHGFARIFHWSMPS